jgi:hypothetical protein
VDLRSGTLRFSALSVSSNIQPAGFDELMLKTIAIATVDRRMHHADVVFTTNGSMGFTNRPAEGGQTTEEPNRG